MAGRPRRRARSRRNTDVPGPRFQIDWDNTDGEDRENLRWLVWMDGQWLGDSFDEEEAVIAAMDYGVPEHVVERAMAKELWHSGYRDHDLKDAMKRNSGSAHDGRHLWIFGWDQRGVEHAARTAAAMGGRIIDQWVSDDAEGDPQDNASVVFPSHQAALAAYQRIGWDEGVKLHYLDRAHFQTRANHRSRR